MRPSRVLASIVIVLLVPVTVWAQQQTIYGCVKNNNGQIRIVAAGGSCLPSEHGVQWTLGGTAPASLPAPTPGPLRVLDQNDVALGVLAAPGYVARQIGDLWIALPVNETGFQITDPFSFLPYYQTTDCTGDQYLPVDATTLLRTGVVMTGANGQPIFSYASTPPFSYTTIHSVAYFNGTGWTCYPTALNGFPRWFGKTASVDLGTFVAPFKIVQ